MDKSILVDIIGQANAENLKMFFVTRILKEGMKANSRVLEKFDFKVYQIEITDEVRKYLYELSLKQFQKIQNAYGNTAVGRQDSSCGSKMWACLLGGDR